MWWIIYGECIMIVWRWYKMMRRKGLLTYWGIRQTQTDNQSYCISVRWDVLYWFTFGYRYGVIEQDKQRFCCVIMSLTFGQDGSRMLLLEAAVIARYEMAQYIVHELQRFPSPARLFCLSVQDTSRPSLHFTPLHYSAYCGPDDKISLLLIKLLVVLYKDHPKGEFASQLKM
jgi:hypothetical protein